MEGVGEQREIGVLQVDVVVEDRFACGGAVLTPVAGERVVLIHELAALEEITELIETVVVEAVAIEFALKMREHDIVAGLCHLIGAVVEEDFRRERQRVGLIHLHVAESIERVVLLVVAGAVAGEDDVVGAETDMTTEDLCVGVLLPVVEQLVGMQEMDARIGLLARLGRTARGPLFGRRRRCCSKRGRRSLSHAPRGERSGHTCQRA